MTKVFHPIPDEALDDRLAGVGTSGSGKSYNLGTAIERALVLKRRVGIVDPTGVWWGLRLFADGIKASTWPIVIFGGEHGDLPLSENAGALIGEACATMSESFIVDLSGLGSAAAERRFMLAFYTALYRKTTRDPLILVTDEADMFAPQVVNDKEGGALKLLGILETIVRRGRVKGFIPWLITQRPAVLNKNVLSQADGLIAMKLTSSQDRAAIGAWIEGQADKADGKAILASLPSLEKGTGVVWIPGRGILETATFPKKRTFDSGRTPARGEKVEAHKLKPLNVSAIAGKLATIEAEVAATDPAKLQARIRELERTIKVGTTITKQVSASTSEDIRRRQAEGAAAIEARGFARGEKLGFASGCAAARMAAIAEIRKILAPVDVKLGALAAAADVAFDKAQTEREAAKAATPAAGAILEISPSRVPPGQPTKVYPMNGAITTPASGSLPAYQVRILEALDFWGGIGFGQVSKAQVAAAAGVSVSSSHYTNSLGALRSAGLIDYPASGYVAMTDAGKKAAPAVNHGGTVLERVASILPAYQIRILEALPRDGSEVTKAAVAAAINAGDKSSHYTNSLGALRTLGLILYPGPGLVRAADWVWQ